MKDLHKFMVKTSLFRLHLLVYGFPALFICVMYKYSPLSACLKLQKHALIGNLGEEKI